MGLAAGRSEPLSVHVLHRHEHDPEKGGFSAGERFRGDYAVFAELRVRRRGANRVRGEQGADAHPEGKGGGRGESWHE